MAAAAMTVAAPQVFALEKVYEDEYLFAISANGNWAAGALDEGSVVIRNLATGEQFTSITDGVNTSYSIGMGPTPISNMGVVAGTTTGNNAAYWHDGKWTELSVPNPEYMSNAMSITPDGSVICGGVGGAEFSVDANDIMLIPAVWYRQADGSYSDAVLLPHPDKDFTGRVPQYITAISVSEDGKKVVGLIRDYLGFMEEPILYTCDDSGEWSYTLLFPELLNPNNIQFPEYPGDYDGMPLPVEEEFMNEEELAAFQAAVEAGLDPDPRDYLTDEEYAEYVKQYNLYVDEFNAWAIKYNAFIDCYFDCVENGYVFTFNNAALNPEATFMVVTRIVQLPIVDPLDGPKEANYPVVLYLDGSKHVDLDGSFEEEGLSLVMSCVAAEGNVLATFHDPDFILPYRAYIFPTMSPTAMPIEDFLFPINPDLVDWMEGLMYHDVAVSVTSTGQFEYSEYMCSGAPVSTPDLSRMICYTDANSWRDYAGVYYYSYLFDTGYSTMVESVEAAEGAITVGADGALQLAGEFSSVVIYDLSGMKVFSATNASGTLATGLSHGIYLLRATDAAGALLTLKLSL